MSKRSARVGAASVLLVAALVTIFSVGLDRGGRAQENVAAEPVSETLEAAKLGAFASGTVLAGPGQVVVPVAGPAGELLWQQDDGNVVRRRIDPARNVTLSVQGLGSCELVFFLSGQGRRYSFRIGPHHDSGALSARAIRNVSWAVEKAPATDCPFLWVLRLA